MAPVRRDSGTGAALSTPPVLPALLLTDLAHVVRCGRKVGLAGSNHDTYVLVRDALMLLPDDSGGWT